MAKIFFIFSGWTELTLSNTCARGPGRATKKKPHCKFSLFIQWKITNHAPNILTFVSEQIAKTKILQNHVGPNIGQYDMCFDLVNYSKNDISRYQVNNFYICNLIVNCSDKENELCKKSVSKSWFYLVIKSCLDHIITF